MVNEGIVYPAVYKRIKCNTDITTKKGLKALLKKLRGSVQKDASFFISVGAEGKTSAVDTQPIKSLAKNYLRQVF